jgi:hypothetical protein
MRPDFRLLPLSFALWISLAPWLLYAKPSDEGPVDLVHLQLLRNEIRRWMREGATPEDDSFDDWAFGSAEGEKQFRDQLEFLLQKKLRELDLMFQLSDSQRRKLKLAGRGDIKRLLDLVEDSRVEFERASVDLSRLPELQRLLRVVDVRVSTGAFEKGSILAKALQKMFDQEELRARSETTVR